MMAPIPDAATQTTVPNQTQLRDSHMKIMYLGLVMNLLLPIVVLLIGAGIRQFMQGGEAEATSTTSRVFFYALLFVAVSELGVTFFLKKQFLNPLPATGTTPEKIPTTSYILSRYLILYNLALAPTFYGLVWYLLGGDFKEFVLFAVIGLVIFRLVRPSTAFYYSLFGARPAVE